MQTASQIRESFLAYFEERGHKRVQSSSLLPENDPTLLFTNAGMNQFKDVFLGLEKRDYQRAASSQKCMRVSGKHNDLETVGRTPRHHTFFEMLGNFSFGDYFKKEAIEYAWELCTQVYGLDPRQLLVTVFQEDDESHEIWSGHIGIPGNRLFRMGVEENFWSMGNVGPCGPCSELHFDFGTSPAGHDDCSLECDCGRYVEIWNLVFMQFNRDASGEVRPLPSPSIDTGMGLERITCVLQERRSNYETDLLFPLIEEAARLTGTRYGESPETDVSLRILADHSRAWTFLVNDGVVPGNEGRGYVLRKILRRAIRHGRMLGKEEPFLFTLTALVAELMKGAYPEILSTRDYSAKVVKYEEEKFSSTLSHGMERLNEICARSADKGVPIPGEELFRLYDTYGFPLDLAKEIAAENQLDVDESGFFTEMEKQKARARASWKGAEKEVNPVYQELAASGLDTEFTGYDQIRDVEGRILAILQGENSPEELAEGETGELVLDRTPFYSESGGQVADRGIVRSREALAEIQDVYTPVTGLRLHKAVVRQGRLRKGDRLLCRVQESLRADTARNHSATHLLHAALREILGEHVKQAGSLVAPDRLRFDFTHFQPLTSQEIRRIEELVNEKIRENIRLRTEVRDLEDALREGAMALFGEKYQKQVRVVKIPGFSTELCGGTHVESTGDIALFKIVSENSVSAGVRRMEAVTGVGALERFLEDEKLLNDLSTTLNVERKALPANIQRILEDLKERQKQIQQLQLKLAQKETGDLSQEIREVLGVRVIAKQVTDLDRSRLRQLADEFKNRLETGVVVLGAPIDGKVSLVAMVSDDLTDKISANDLIRRIAPLVGGGGGGKPEMAEAGGRDASRLADALEETYRAVEELLA